MSGLSSEYSLTLKPPWYFLHVNFCVLYNVTEFKFHNDLLFPLSLFVPCSYMPISLRGSHFPISPLATLGYISLTLNTSPPFNLSLSCRAEIVFVLVPSSIVLGAQGCPREVWKRKNERTEKRKTKKRNTSALTNERFVPECS